MTRQMADDEVLRVLDMFIDGSEESRQVTNQLREARAAVAALQAERDQARKYATTLAQAMLRKHYAEDAPQWEPCPDLLGVLTQIDNMTTGLTRTERAERAEAERDALRDDVKLLTHKVITCGVAAANPDPELSSSGPYGGEWDSPQAQDVRALRSRADALEALRGQVAGLVEKWRAESNALPTLSHKGAGLDRGITELSALLAIKERMG